MTLLSQELYIHVSDTALRSLKSKQRRQTEVRTEALSCFTAGEAAPDDSPWVTPHSWGTARNSHEPQAQGTLHLQHELVPAEVSLSLV